VLIAVVVNVALPRLMRITVEWRWAIALPIIAWVVVLIVLGYANTGRGSVLVPGYGGGEYVGLGLFFLGALAGFVSVVRERTPVRVASARP
jgi:polyferredoxin